MCGFIGVINYSSNSANESLFRSDTLIHRGPDDTGEIRSNTLLLKFWRLSILDLSVKGHQPMQFGKLIIAHNGEIYNFKEVRQNLEKEGYSFESETDTEVFLKAFHYWGIDCVKQFNGMFATVIMDEEQQQLHLLRDRVGIKPLYYVHKPGSFFGFASEIKAFRSLMPLKENREKVFEYLVYRSVLGRKTLFKGVYALMPGEHLFYDCREDSYQHKIYYSPECETLDVKSEVAIRLIDELLIDSVDKRLISDVEVGLQLSGGVDSSLIAAIVQTHFRKSTLHSFSISIPESPELDESSYQRMVAEQYNIEHHEIPFTGSDFADYLERVVWHSDYPIVHPNAVTILKLSEFAKNYITVLLSGEGADESFWGYPKYKFAVHRKKLDFLLRFNPLASALLPGIGKMGTVKRLIKGIPDFSNLFVETRKNTDLLQFLNPAAISCGYNKRLDLMNSQNREQDVPIFDQATSLRELLRRFDRMTMAASIEGRVPFCDHRVMELANSLPAHLKANGKGLKFILKKVAEQYLPYELIHREKMGFSLPIQKWFSEQNTLQHKINWLEEGCFLDRKIIDPDQFLAWRKSGNCDPKEFDDILWPLISYEMWHREFFE